MLLPTEVSTVRCVVRLKGLQNTASVQLRLAIHLWQVSHLGRLNAVDFVVRGLRLQVGQGVLHTDGVSLARLRLGCANWSLLLAGWFL